jgi:hypothetical protein
LSSSDPPIDVQRWRLDIAYDGNAFSGFAYQPEFTTVVGLYCAKRWPARLSIEEPMIVGAGRTDSRRARLSPSRPRRSAATLTKVRVLEGDRLMRIH